MSDDMDTDSDGSSHGNRRGDIRVLFDYIHKLATMLMVGLLVWAGGSINQGNIQIALLTERVSQLAKGFEDINKNRYSAADAARDFAFRDQRIQELEQRERDVRP